MLFPFPMLYVTLRRPTCMLLCRHQHSNTFQEAYSYAVSVSTPAELIRREICLQQLGEPGPRQHCNVTANKYLSSLYLEVVLEYMSHVNLVKQPEHRVWYSTMVGVAYIKIQIILNDCKSELLENVKFPGVLIIRSTFPPRAFTAIIIFITCFMYWKMLAWSS